MRSEVEKAFNDYLVKILNHKPSILRAAQDNSAKGKAIDMLCEELIRAGNRFDLRYYRRYDIIVQGAAHIYLKKLMSFHEFNLKSDAEKTRLQRDHDEEKRIIKLIDSEKPITDTMLIDNE